MNENDFLKKFIQQHRTDFDDEPLPPGLLNKTLIKNKQKRKRKLLRMIAYSVSAAACLLLIVNYSYTFRDKTSKNHITVTYDNYKATDLNSTTSKNKELIPDENQDTDKPTRLIVNNQNEAVGIRTKTASEKPNAVNYPARFAYQSQYKQMIADLTKNESVPARINAVLQAAEVAQPDEILKNLIGNMLTNDENSNVRLTAFNVLAGFNQDSTTRKYMVNSLGTEQDPFVQLELIRFMQNDYDTIVTEKLVEIILAPFTLPEVKDQAYYALLDR